MGLTRKFLLHKRGELVEATFTGSDKFRAQGTFQPLRADRIVGVDTESLKRRSLGGRLSTVLVPLWFSTGAEVIQVTDDGSDALDAMLGAVCERYSVPEERPSRTVQRERRVRHDGMRRDGRREAVDPVLLVFFNLPYDIGRLCSEQPQFLRALASGADTYKIVVGSREVEVCRTVLGAGSSFEWMVRSNECVGEPRITRLLGIDCHGYWKSSLRLAAKAAGVTEKVAIDLDWERSLEDLSDDEWREFKRYAAGDAQSTAELYAATVTLLRTIDARVVRRTGVIPPSAPGAAARIAFSKAHDLHPETKTWRRYPAWADQLGCDAYRGARCFNARPGRHEAVLVRDIKSAYPYALTQLPDPVTLKCERVGRVAGPAAEERILGLRGKFGVLKIDGAGLDPVYPALRCHDAGRIRLVYGPFHGLAATIPEIVIGLETGTLRVDAISDGVIMQGDPEKSFLRHAMLDFFALKENPNNEPALYNLGKLLATSTYGKLIEVQCNQHWLDSGVLCPPFKDQAGAASFLARLYAETSPEKFDDAAACYIEKWGNHGIGCRDPFCLGCGGEPVLDGPAMPIRSQLSRFKRYECGQYFMPLYAAQITGFISATLALMARVTRAMQGDTDSVHHSATRSDDSEFYAAMKRSGYPWPRSGLGHWAMETHVPSAESLCGRIKLYSHRFNEPVSKCGECGAGPGVACRCAGSESRYFKQARHGFSKYPGGCEALHEAIREITEGRSHTYTTRPSPRKIRQALVMGLPVGEFVSREVKINAGKDSNTRVENGVCEWLPLGPNSPYYRGDEVGGNHGIM